MNVFLGMQYNIKGLFLALKTPKLLWLGILRFFVVLFFTLLLSGLILYWHDAILNLIWDMPESGWLVYVWKTVSWILSFFLSAVAMVLAYLISQVLFCVFIMDYMSRITETIVSGKQIEFQPESWTSFFLYLIKQEIPRAIIPVVITLLVMVIGLLTPLGPVILILSSITAAVFLAWDNTDLTPARRMVPFNDRFGYLKRNIFFHIGFGILFLIPWVNIVFLSFAPVGATMYYVENEKA